MARTKKQVKVKEPVRLRFNELKDGRKSSIWIFTTMAGELTSH